MTGGRERSASARAGASLSMCLGRWSLGVFRSCRFAVVGVGGCVCRSSLRPACRSRPTLARWPAVQHSLVLPRLAAFAATNTGLDWLGGEEVWFEVESERFPTVPTTFGLRCRCFGSEIINIEDSIGGRVASAWQGGSQAIVGLLPPLVVVDDESKSQSTCLRETNSLLSNMSAVGFAVGDSFGHHRGRGTWDELHPVCYRISKVIRFIL
ncbi:hypothetical protein BDD12DRAFT_259315 [Trichophaea hybrida]|nr:hypothetical protein BDD12DRAFT_259315 [Trichophaea hybrida]